MRTQNIMTKVENSHLKLRFIEGDIVLARCQMSIPLPAVISFYRGADQTENEVFYKVLFVGGGWAYVPSNQIHFLTFSRISELRVAMKKRTSFINNLGKSEQMLIKLGESQTGKLKDRYNQIYLSEEPIDISYFNKIQLNKTSNISVTRHSIDYNFQKNNNNEECEIRLEDQKKRSKGQKYKKCKKITYIQFEIRIRTQESKLKIYTRLNDFISSYEQQLQLPNVLQQVDLNQLSFEQIDAKSISRQVVQHMMIDEQENQKKNKPETEEFFYDRDTSAQDEKQNEQKQILQSKVKVDVDNVLFMNIQSQIRKSFQQLQDYMKVFHKERNYEISQSSKILKGINLQKIELKIKEILGHLKDYNLTIHQRKTIFECLETFTYYFIEFQTSDFLLRNISKIRDLISNWLKESYPLQRVPVLGIYEFVNRMLREWVDIIDQDYYREKNTNKKVVSSDLRQRELLRCAILNKTKNYQDKLKDFKCFILN